MADTQPNDVETTFQYLQWQDLFNHEKPFEILIDIPADAPDQRKTNLIFHDGIKEIVHDVRTNISNYTLDGNGFVYLNHQSELVGDDFKDRALVEATYLPECEKLLKENIPNVDQVYFYNWRLRKGGDESFRQNQIINFSDPVFPLGPATHVHVDQSPATIVERVHMHLPEQADYLLRGRVQHINIWRPIHGPIQESPLAVCDGTTLPSSMLVETDRIRRQYAGCTLFAMFKEGYKWHYMSEHKDNEPLLFKSFDSDANAVSYAGHASFSLPTAAKKDVLPRESIEVRALVFTYPDNVPRARPEVV